MTAARDEEKISAMNKQTCRFLLERINSKLLCATDEEEAYHVGLNVSVASDRPGYTHGLHVLRLPLDSLVNLSASTSLYIKETE